MHSLIVTLQIVAIIKFFSCEKTPLQIELINVISYKNKLTNQLHT